MDKSKFTLADMKYLGELIKGLYASPRKPTNDEQKLLEQHVLNEPNYAAIIREDNTLADVWLLKYVTWSKNNGLFVRDGEINIVALDTQASSRITFVSKSMLTSEIDAYIFNNIEDKMKGGSSSKKEFVSLINKPYDNVMWPLMKDKIMQTFEQVREYKNARLL